MAISTATSISARDVQRRFHRWRWSIYVILALGYLWVYFHRMAPAAVSEALAREFAMSAAALGVLAAMYYYISMVMQIPAGVMADSLGTRVAVATGNTVAGIGSITFGLAPTFEVAIIGRFLVGLGVSVVFVSFMKSNAQWFGERSYGLVSGVTLLLGNVGSMLAAAPLTAALSLASWRTIFVAIGVFSIALGGASAIWVRNKPADVGLPTPLHSDSMQLGTQRGLQESLYAVLRTRGLWPGFWLNFAMVGTFYAFVGLWAVPFLRQTHGLTAESATGYTTLALLGFALSAVAYGWVSDWMGRRKPLVLFSTSLYLSCWVALYFLPWEQGWSANVIFLVMGLAAGGFVLTYPCAKEVCPPQLAGMAMSVVNTGVFAGAALVQSVFGWVLDLRWSGQFSAGRRIYSTEAYDAGLMLMLVLAAVSMVAAFWLRETNCRNVTNDLEAHVVDGCKQNV